MMWLIRLPGYDAVVVVVVDCHSDDDSMWYCVGGQHQMLEIVAVGMK